jgi:hypothetical protein
LFPILLSTATVQAEELCTGTTSGMGCFDAAPMPGPAEPSPFRWFGRGKVLRYGQVASSVVLRYAVSPADLVAPGSDVEGRLVPVVRRTTRLDLRLAAGLGRNLDLTLTLPTAIHQTGSGPDALLSQAPEPLRSGGFGDPRLSARLQLPEALDQFAWAMRLELSVPLGDERAYVGSRSWTEALALNAQWSDSGVSVVSELGLRIAAPVRFGDVRLGSHLFWGLGLDVAPLARDLLHVTLEGYVRPSLQTSPTLESAVGHPSLVMPAEWMLSVSSRPLPAELWFSLGAGTALPLSHRSGSDNRVDASFVAPTSPRSQWLFSVATLF